MLISDAKANKKKEKDIYCSYTLCEKAVASMMPVIS